MSEMEESVRRLLNARRLGYDANELLMSIMDRWGGPRQFAYDLHAEFQNSKAGGLLRQNILEMIQKLVVNNTNHNITKIVDPADLDTQDIEERVQAMIRRVQDFEDARKRRSAESPETVEEAWKTADHSTG